MTSLKNRCLMATDYSGIKCDYIIINPPKKLVSGAADSLHKASCDSSVIQLAPEARVGEGKEAISIEWIKLWSRDIKGDY